MFYLIYKITNKLNGKIYIGSHKTKSIDDGYMGSGKYLNRAYNIHGIENFTKEILCVFDNAKDMYAKEAEIVNEEFLSEENTYNLKIGGFGGWDYINTTGKNIYGSNGQPGFGGENLHKSKTKDRLISQGRFEQYKENIANTLKEGYESGRIKPSFAGKKHSEETLQKLKGHKRQVGDLNSQFGTKWAHDPITKINKKIKGSLPDRWEYGKHKELKIKEKTLSKKERNPVINTSATKQHENRKKQIDLYRDYYIIYKEVGFDKFVEQTGYTKSKANLVQRFADLLDEFVPQNGKRRG
jgi:hypothetical protein